MTNNDFLRRFRYALDIPDSDVVKSFKEADVDISVEEVKGFFAKEDEAEFKKLNNKMLGNFLDGFIILKRGKKELKPGQEPRKTAPLTQNNINNALLKKIKIALNFQSQDMIDVFKYAGVNVSNSELSSLFRKSGHKNYKECLDSHLRNFLKGLTKKYRGV